jgi:hypothetical protein
MHRPSNAYLLGASMNAQREGEVKVGRHLTVTAIIVQKTILKKSPTENND